MKINITDIHLSRVMNSSVKWDEMFQSERDLMLALACLKTTKYTEKGQETVANLIYALINNGQLTPKQMTQLKRISKFIFIHYKRKQSQMLQIIE